MISYAGDSKETFYIGPIMDDEKLENDINQWPSKGIFCHVLPWIGVL